MNLPTLGEGDHEALTRIAQKNSQDQLKRAKKLETLPRLASIFVDLTADGSKRLRTVRKPGA